MRQMNWFKKKLIKWLKDDYDNKDTIGYANSPKVSREGNTLNSDATLNFTVYNAIGGKVVEFRRYNRNIDRSDTTIYVVSRDEDFGQKISKIATLEVMKD